MTKILVVEDEAELRRDIIDVLTLENYEAFGAENGEAGIEATFEHKPDLIVCDIMMPVMDGYEMLAHLRSNNSTATIPFIFLTAKSGDNERIAGMNYGADDYLTKPFKIEHLMKTIEARLEKYRIQQKIEAEKLAKLRNSIMMALPHELRTPLTSILGFADILSTDARDMDISQIETMAGFITNGALRLHHLIENYLAYAQLEIFSTDLSRQEAMRQHQTDLPGQCVEIKALEVAQQSWNTNNLIMDIEPGKAVQIHEEYLMKIVEELVSNAFKFSDAGKPVKVCTRLSDNDYVIQVINYGRGMSRDEIERIGAFMQFDRRIYEQQGLGLGLSIVSRLVEIHQGKFVIESVPDEMTTASVYLPLAEF
ncbi:MAG: hybrid sensor histidine kinase/response regulator [Chloroflexi bacterium]|nr:MAG: hybrid sensor histidine kinase/response regulator [Phototrophicales bacterium]RMF80489.1 MAG: hybrid sensor histidine kinase/response regulator [Chloroflexota bacterium]